MGNSHSDQTKCDDDNINNSGELHGGDTLDVKKKVDISTSNTLKSKEGYFSEEESDSDSDEYSDDDEEENNNKDDDKEANDDKEENNNKDDDNKEESFLDELDLLEKKIKDQDKKIKLLEYSNSELHIEMETKEEASNLNLERYKIKYESLKITSDKSCYKINELENKNKNLTSIIEVNSEMLNKVNKLNSTLELRININLKNVSELKKQNSDLKKDIEDGVKTINKLNNDNYSNIKSLRKIKNTVAEKNIKLEKFINDVDVLKGELENTTKMVIRLEDDALSKELNIEHLEFNLSTIDDKIKNILSKNKAKLYNKFMNQDTEYWMDADINDIKDCIFKDIFKSIKSSLISDLNK